MLYVDIELNNKVVEDHISTLQKCGETELARLYEEFYRFYTADITFEEIMLYVEQQQDLKEGTGDLGMEDISFEII